MKLESKFDIGDHVLIDGCEAVRAVVVNIQWFGVGLVRYELSWFKDGANVEYAYFDEWRLTKR